MATIRKWLVTFTTPASKGAFLKEEVCATDWLYAKLLIESKYQGVKITNYREI